MMMKKSLAALLLAAALCFTMIACAAQDQRSVDERFVESLADGLDARWELTSANEGSTNITKEDWEGYINAERNAIIEFDGATFEDPNLGSYAQAYIDSIVASSEALGYYGTNQWASKYTNGIYQDRVVALYHINALAPIPVSEANTDQLRSLVADGEVSDMVNSLLSTVSFELAEDDGWGWRTYEAVVENTTTANFEYFAFVVDMIDEDGVTVETQNATVTQWSAGEKARFEFSTDVAFTEMTIAAAEWYF